MRRLKKLITTHSFDHRMAAKAILGPNTRVAGDTYTLELAPTAGKYPLAADLWAKTRLARPKSMKQAIGFEANVVHTAINGVLQTAVKYRLSSDGAEELFWDGADWSPAADGEWNTEAEIANHIDTFPMANQAVQVILNLATTNPKFTPRVYWVKVLWTSDIEFMEDYVERSFIPALRAGVLPIADYIVKIAAPAATVSLAPIETAYTIAGIDAVYNLSTDPNKLTDIAGAWDAGAKTVALTVPANADERIYVRFIYRLPVALTTDQDYGQVAKVPAIQLEDVYLANDADLIGDDSVLNKDQGVGWKLQFGTQADIIIAMRVITDKEKDAQRLSEALKAFFDTNTTLVSVGYDEEFTVMVDRPYAHATIPSQAGLHGARITVKILKAVFYLVDAVPIFGAKAPLVMGGGGNVGS